MQGLFTRPKTTTSNVIILRMKISTRRCLKCKDYSHVQKPQHRIMKISTWHFYANKFTKFLRLLLIAKFYRVRLF
uniref:Ovule protein n=1 Tax=Strongyloides papillosus TaxID=174720 RepID=A0A0N5BW46_STREA